ncbi:DUF1573 domain-containing protein [Bacteroides sp. 14(A)]|jgi:hypothetical protein|uniref:DUF1573 domain-containing protein n=1 Tax=Bacteroides sp. 14(A) TaxID=1163670 RepID=UPI000478552A|nr:DUF1573 domain-containing protein [Bacteroides sp. 14(A)]
MKIFILILTIVVALVGCAGKENNQNRTIIAIGNSKSSKDSLAAYLVISPSKYDFGTISQKEHPELNIYFNIENKGRSPLVIQKADVSCGCVSVDYPQYPIPSQEKTKLLVHIKTTKQLETFNKVIFIKSNANNDVELIRIKGRITR